VKLHPKVIATGISIFIGLGIIAGGLYLLKMHQIKQGQGPGFVPQWAVEPVQAKTTTWQATSQLVGTAFAIQSVTVSNELSGTVKSVGFESGAVVEAGQVLIQQDTSTEQADLEAAQAAVAVADAGARVVQANIDLWESNVRRISRAVEANASPATELDNARAQLASNHAQLDQSRASSQEAKARVAQIQAMIDKKTIRAPFKARTGLRTVHPGQYLGEGSQIVALQSITDQIYLDFAVPQEHAQRVKVGDTFIMTSKVLDNRPVPIKVFAIDATVNTNTRNIRVRALLDNKDQRIAPGMFVDVEVPISPPQSYVVVPSTAVRRSSFGDHVFLIMPGEKKGDPELAEQKFVTLGPTLDDMVIVKEGLKEGELLAGAGSFKLYPKALVMRAQGDLKPGDMANAPKNNPGASHDGEGGSGGS
jgi:membrane fusion protein, multidrug efflux system